MNQTIFADLRNCLAKLYPDEPSIRRITADAGLDTLRIIFNNSAINNWHSVLTEASKLNQVDALLGVIEREYSNNEEFQRVSFSYRQLADQLIHANLEIKITEAIVSPDMPYHVAVPFTEPRYFFGRERELRRLFSLWQRPPLQNAAIIGPKRSGKTWLLQYLKTITTAPASQVRPGQRRNWLPEPEQYRWVYVDFQDPRLSTQEGLLHYLLVALSLRVPRQCNLESFMDVVSDGLENPTLILFDEIGVALARYFALDDTFWEGLRSLASNYVNGNLGFVLAAHGSPIELAQQSNHSSPFFNIFGYTTDLKPLTEAEARTLISTSPLSFDESDVMWILEQSRGWPILLQALCRNRLAALDDGEADDMWKVDGVRQIAEYSELLKIIRIIS